MKFRTVNVVETSTAILLSEGLSGVRAVLDFMTGETLYTHQLPRAHDEANRYILDQHPWIADLDLSGVHDKEIALAFTAKLEAKYGEYLELVPMPVDDHDAIDPFEEAARMIGADRVIRIDLDSEEDEQ